MSMNLPRCPYCSNPSIVGEIAGKLAAVCTQCNNGYAIVADDFASLTQRAFQMATKGQVEQAIGVVQQHLNKHVDERSSALREAENELPGDKRKLTKEQQKKAAELESQRILLAGILQGGQLYKELLGKALGIVKEENKAV
ncbi:hypothetical protein PPEP_a4273 [Pseudoalteromonas peptidolytica F12-50-A1]|uniref:Uncharacterized protein n=2 Tax=Pseudoalteromonas peptidolytica TaxID=61150 RepID=A0A8I0T4Y0_9GAMM|nr:hypothetical protein [Pseudoalteromonas peptidolytica F12-50-A1]GEK08016.1 hypothetical protein PPE03_02650 [Pseudoalteromonas peptidolytica]